MVHTNHFFSLEGEGKRYISSVSIDKYESTNFDACEHIILEFLNCLKTYGLLNHSIKLKIGSLNMLLRNLDQSECLHNGTRLIVARLANHVIIDKIICDKNIGNIIYISRMSMSHLQSP